MSRYPNGMYDPRKDGVQWWNKPYTDNNDETVKNTSKKTSAERQRISQEVLEILITEGEIYARDIKQMGITRYPTLISNLRKDGWLIETKRIRHKTKFIFCGRVNERVN